MNLESTMNHPSSRAAAGTAAVWPGDRARSFLPLCQLADQAYKKTAHLDNFAGTFLVKCTPGQTNSRHMVSTASEQNLLRLWPYLVDAVKHIVDWKTDHTAMAKAPSIFQLN